MECSAPKNLLDQALDHYDRVAKQYFEQKSTVENAPPDVRESCKKELAEVQRHLENQRVNANVLADIQAQLDLYREQGRQATIGTRSEVAKKQNELKLEKHHPPRELEKMLKAACRPKPSRRHSAHHVVAGKGWTTATYRARVRLHELGIRINDPDNGVWLPKAKTDTPLWSMPDALAHKQYHTKMYEAEVARKLLGFFSEQQVRIQLQLIGKALEQNKFPYKREAE